MAMIHSCDAFVFLDDVQFEKQSWQQRNRIKGTNGQPMWLTVPVMRDFGQKINEVQINTQLNWQKKHAESIKQAYSKAPFWYRYNRDFLLFYAFDGTLNLGALSCVPPWRSLCELNIKMIYWLQEELCIDCPEYFRASDLRTLAAEANGTATDRLVALLQRVGTTEYLANPGSMGYLEPERDKFDKAGIDLKVFNFHHPVYPQIRGNFISHLSAIDLLFNTGNKAIDYIREGQSVGR